MPVTIVYHTWIYPQTEIIKPEPYTGDVRFYLGSANPSWLKRTTERLFISDNTLGKYKTLPRALGPWGLDSGGFSELKDHGTWRIDANEYAGHVRRYAADVGKLEWAAPQDWMCEPFMLRITGLSNLEHRKRTVRNFIELQKIAEDLPIKPVVQGYQIDEYLECIDMYGEAGVDLREYDTVGVGSVCRRQKTDEISDVMQAIWEKGIRIHGFGVKTAGMAKYGKYLVSSDSMAWSMYARKHSEFEGTEGCRYTHINCANCYPFAMKWSENLRGNVCE
jgi:hypothetical protein